VVHDRKVVFSPALLKTTECGTLAGEYGEKTGTGGGIRS